MSSFKNLWKELYQIEKKNRKRNIISLFSEENRFENFSTEYGKIFIDFSKTNIDHYTLKKLFHLIEHANLKQKKNDLFEGKKINLSESSSPKHIFYRRNNFLNQSEKELFLDNKKMFQISENIRTGKYLGVTKKKFKKIVNIGIGGSRNGCELITSALRKFSTGPEVLFISSPDSNEFDEITSKLNPFETLFIIVSKSFKTVETRQNAKKLFSWLKKNFQCDPSNHIICVTNNKKEAENFFSDKIRILDIPKDLGGRYGLWGPFSLSALCNIGLKNFKSFLEGAREIDENFFFEENKNNLPLVLSAIDVWHRNFCNYQTKSLIPYDYNLKYFINYIQQLEMESNSKKVNIPDVDNVKSSPILWGSTGSEAQHSFFQFLHQGSDKSPCEFLIGINDHIRRNSQERDLLIKSCLAQSEALMLGNTGNINEENLYKLCEGNRPSTTIFFESLTPKILGSLISIYEHKTFINGIFWKINSFDQWGVEMAKKVFNSYNLKKFNNSYSNKIKAKINMMKKNF